MTEKLKLSEDEKSVLLLLVEHHDPDAPMRLGQLATRLGLSPVKVAGTIDVLRRRGLLNVVSIPGGRDALIPTQEAIDALRPTIAQIRRRQRGMVHK